MDKIVAHTKTEKGLQYLNLLSIVSVFVFLILLQALSLILGIRYLLYIASIIFTVLNAAFYVVPANLKLTFLKKRMLFVYLPSVIILIFSIYDLISIVMDLAPQRILSIIFTGIVDLQAITFSMLVAKLAAGQQGLLQ